MSDICVGPGQRCRACGGEYGEHKAGCVGLETQLRHADDAAERLRYWMRDFGHLKEEVFIRDLKKVLDDRDRLLRGGMTKEEMARVRLNGPSLTMLEALTQIAALNAITVSNVPADPGGKEPDDRA